MQPTSLAGRRSLVVALVALAGGALAQTGGIFQCEDRDGVFINPVTGQECVTTIQTAVPFLTITPDARAGAMGDVGVATSPTAASTFFNGSALAFADEPFAVQQVGYDRPITVLSWGERQPVAPNDTPEGRFANRRVEVRID